MALTRNKPRPYSNLRRSNQLPLATATAALEGSAIGIQSSTGRARPLVAGDLFAGFAVAAASSVADVTGTTPTHVRLHVEGEVQLAIAGVAETNVGASVYASDDDTFALTGTSLVGEVLRVPSTGTAVVGFLGGRSRLSSVETLAGKALVSDAGSLVRVSNFADKSADLSRVQAVFYKQNEGTGTSLAEDGGDGPSITVTGTTSGAWANAGYFTHDAAGNVIKIANNPYIDGLISMETECSILIGVDLYITAWPSSTESIWALHRDDLSGGGVRFPMASGSAGRFGVYYRASGGGSTTEQTGIALGSYLNQRLSFLTELRVIPSLNELRIYLYINGRMERANTVALGTPPATNSAGGLYLSGYGSTPLQKLGAGGSGARTANFFCVRHSGTDRNIAGRLAAYVAANQALPTWLTRI